MPLLEDVRVGASRMHAANGEIRKPAGTQAFSLFSFAFRVSHSSRQSSVVSWPCFADVARSTAISSFRFGSPHTRPSPLVLQRAHFVAEREGLVLQLLRERRNPAHSAALTTHDVKIL